MTFDQIQYFIAIAECNTYFDAAEELNISQSALSKQIIKLEKEIIMETKNMVVIGGGAGGLELVTGLAKK